MKFNETYYLIESGHKVCTSRIPYKKWFDWYDRLANVEHKTFLAEGPLPKDRLSLRLKSCEVRGLYSVASYLYYDEGYEKPEDFIAIWKKIYGSYRPNQKVTTIFFEKLGKYE